MDSEDYKPRKASEYCALKVIQLPHDWNFLETSQFGK